MVETWSVNIVRMRQVANPLKCGIANKSFPEGSRYTQYGSLGEVVLRNGNVGCGHHSRSMRYTTRKELTIWGATAQGVGFGETPHSESAFATRGIDVEGVLCYCNDFVCLFSIEITDRIIALKV